MRRPRTSFSEPLAREICRRAREGQGVVAICAEPGMPDPTTLRRWARRVPAFAADLDRARAAYAVTEGFGRSYTEKLADAVCVRVAGGESIEAICADAHMPKAATLFWWLERHPDFAAKYRRARALSADAGLAPIAYSQAVADDFCARIAAGEQLRTVCQRPGMPHPATIHQWLSRHPDFAASYDQARELRRLGGHPGQVRYSEAVASELFERLVAGESLMEICADPTMPSHPTVQAWRRERPDFKRRFIEAREEAAELVEDHVLYVVNTVTPETAAAGRVKLTGLNAMAGRRQRAAERAADKAPPPQAETMTIRFIDPDGSEWKPSQPTHYPD